ncbi:hypothetical protein CHCC20335_3242 [Bacillus paralicheniformis]|nr:hypothetical protein CHCC20335_3242 [Bacillus paralicheniformis]
MIGSCKKFFLKMIKNCNLWVYYFYFLFSPLQMKAAAFIKK